MAERQPVEFVELEQSGKWRFLGRGYEARGAKGELIGRRLELFYRR